MKTRIIKTSIYSDEKILSLTPDARFICVYLYTNSHIGLTDIYKIPVQIIQLETGYDISTIRLVLDQLHDFAIIKHSKHLWIKLLRPDFASLQYSGGPNEKAIDKYNSEIPLEIKEYFENDTTAILPSMVAINKKLEIRNKKLEIRNSEKSVFGEFENVKLTPEEHHKLKDSLGEKASIEFIEELSGYIASKGAKYKSHYATILNWSRRRSKEFISKSKPIYAAE